MVRTIQSVKFMSNVTPVKGYEWTPIWDDMGTRPNDYDCSVQHWQYAIKVNRWAMIITVRD